jgi:alpha-tubulin suppressor-like RCC1 family protein
LQPPFLASLAHNRQWRPQVASSALAVAKDSRLFGWGADNNGQLGQNRLQFSATPVPIAGGYRQLSIGGNYVAAVKTDNTLWAWGGNSSGQLGDGSTESASAPKLIGSGYCSVTATTSVTFAIKVDGSLWAWGQGIFGAGQSFNTSRIPIPLR